MASIVLPKIGGGKMELVAATWITQAGYSTSTMRIKFSDGVCFTASSVDTLQCLTAGKYIVYGIGVCRDADVVPSGFLNGIGSGDALVNGVEITPAVNATATASVKSTEGNGNGSGGYGWFIFKA